MSYIYNPLLKQNLQKWETGSGSDPDYSKIKGSLIKGYSLNDSVLSAGYPVYISSFDENGIINYASRRGFAREIVQTKSLVLDAKGSEYVNSFPVMTGNSSGLCYMSYYEYYQLLADNIGSKITVYGSTITGWGIATPLLTGSVITSNLYVAISTGDKVEKLSYSNFFSSIDGDCFGTYTTGLTGHTPQYLFATITENSGQTIERLSLAEIRNAVFSGIEQVSGSLLSGVSGVFVKFGSNARFLTKTDFNTWLNS